MIQLPYRDIIPQPDNGGSIEDGINAYKEKYHGKKRPSYKSKWEEMTRKRNRWRNWAIGILGGYVIAFIAMGMFDTKGLAFTAIVFWFATGVELSWARLKRRQKKSKK
jgi:hypothetical protein